jgi:YidC/Oxa1 family membrane protein insertase
MDKNQVIGIALIVLVMIGYYVFFAPEPKTPEPPAQVEQVATTAETSSEIQASASTIQAPQDSASIATHDAALLDKYGIFAGATQGTGELINLSNERLSVDINTHGGLFEQAILTDYHSYWDSLPVSLWDPANSSMAIGLTYLGKGHLTTSDFFFTSQNVKSKATSGSPATATLLLATNDPGKFLELNYTLPAESDEVKCTIRAVGLDGIFDFGSQKPTLNWHAEGWHIEKGIDQERQCSSVFFRYMEKDRDFLSERSADEEELTEVLNWMTFKQSYFSAMVISDEGFVPGGRLASAPPALETDTLHNTTYDAQLLLPMAQSANSQTALRFYFGPNQYDHLKATKVTEAVRIIDYGWWIFGWINRNAIRPVFNFLSSHIASAGLVIIILTVLIKMLLFPITWKNYLSSAKMRVLKPQIDEINKKFEGKPATEKQAATMALYRQTGVNPFAGCLPMLLQLPILYAMFRFFPSAIELRGQGFLWADDLGAYDAIITWSQEIPLLSSFYGNHISGFTVLMAASTFFYTRMSTANMPAQNQPGMPNMKVIMNIFPFMMLIFFNKFAAGLSFYYLMANLISIGQMYAIKRWFVDEDKISAKIEENKAKPKKKSAFSERLAEAQKMQAKKKKK